MQDDMVLSEQQLLEIEAEQFLDEELLSKRIIRFNNESEIHVNKYNHETNE